MAKVTALEGKSKPVFNPQASYKWEPADLFEITGLQLAKLYHCLIRQAHSVEGSTPAQIYEAYDSILDVLKRGVEQGVIIEESVQTPKEVNEIEDKVNTLFAK